MKAAGTPSPLGSSVEPEDQGTGHPGPTRTPASSATPSGRAGHRATHPCPATEKTHLTNTLIGCSERAAGLEVRGDLLHGLPPHPVKAVHVPAVGTLTPGADRGPV